MNNSGTHQCLSAPGTNAAYTEKNNLYFTKPLHAWFPKKQTCPAEYVLIIHIFHYFMLTSRKDKQFLTVSV